jgi:hypothetical protein
MFKIIGADQREYGPVTADQVREWIAEGRANAATLVQPEGGTTWVPLGNLPEFAEALAAKTPPTPPPPLPLPSDPVALADHVRARDYDLDIGRCVSRSWALFQQHAGLLIGATFVFLVLVLAWNQVVGLLTRSALRSLVAGDIRAGPILVLLLGNIPGMVLSTILSGGLYLLLLKLSRGQPAGIGDLFGGFGAPVLHLALAGIVVRILTMLGILLCILPGIYLSVAWILTVPIIVDRRLEFWSAMELSRRVVTQHWWLMFCLVIVAALINLGGLIACCVGIIAAFPIGLGAFVYAYEDIFAGPGGTSS